MKKIFAFFCLFSQINFAQIPLKKSYHFGIKTGFALSHVEGARQSSRLKAGFEGGMWLRLKLTKKLNAQFELLFVEKGTGGRIIRKAYYNNYWIEMYYFELPLLLQYHYEKFILEFGPGFGYLAQAVESMPGSSSSNLADEDPFYNREFSMNLGFVYTIGERWNLGFRYTNSVFPVRKASNEKNHWNQNVYNSVFAITLAHSLKVKAPKKVVEHGDAE